MDNGKIKAIVFDLGRVMVDFDHRIAARGISRFSHKSGDEIYALFFDSEVTGLFEEGKISPEDFFLRIKKALGLDLSYEEFVAIWNEIFFVTEENRMAYELAARLRRHYRVAMLSNINILHHKHLKAKFALFEPFDPVITSYELRVRKPDPAIYQKMLQMLRLKAEEVFYTDDRPELIESARQLGINSCVFSGSRQLKDDLLSYGVRICQA